MSKKDEFAADRARVGDATFGKGTSDTKQFKQQTADLRKLIEKEGKK